MKSLKSKFSFFPILLCFLFTSILIMLVFLAGTSPEADLYLPAFGVLFGCFFWLTEFRTKAHKIYIVSDTIAVRPFFGLGKRKEFKPTDIQGFYSTKQTGGSGNYEYLFLINDQKRLICASAFYHHNYKQLKQELEKRFPNLGERKFSFTAEYAEMFK